MPGLGVTWGDLRLTGAWPAMVPCNQPVNCGWPGVASSTWGDLGVAWSTCDRLGGLGDSGVVLAFMQCGTWGTQP